MGATGVLATLVSPEGLRAQTLAALQALEAAAACFSAWGFIRLYSASLMVPRWRRVPRSSVMASSAATLGSAQEQEASNTAAAPFVNALACLFCLRCVILGVF